MKFKHPLRLEIDGSRTYGLDILRAMAILFVVVEHSRLFMPEKVGAFLGYLMFDGVSIFFVLSGFLIGSILIKTITNKQPTFRNLFEFWIRRWLRTLPNYFLILLLLCVLYWILKPGFDPGIIKPYLLFIQNLNSPHPYFFGEAWSLSVEEWFYLLVPPFLFLAIRFFRLSVSNAILLVAIAIISLSTGIRIYKYLHVVNYTTEFWDASFRKEVVTRLDSIMYGLIGAFVNFRFKAFWVRHKNKMFIAGIVLFALEKTSIDFHLMNQELYMCVFYFTRTAIATLLLLPFLNELKSGKGFFYKFFTGVSLISYSMYLVNYTLIRELVVKNMFNQDQLSTAGRLAECIVFYALTGLVSILLYKYFEKPVMNLRERFSKHENA